MNLRNPALFYFWAHTDSDGKMPQEELDTPVFNDLVRKSDVLFLESVSSTVEGKRELEGDLNEFVRTGIMPEKLSQSYKHQMKRWGITDEKLFIAKLIQGTGKRIVLERALLGSPDRYESFPLAGVGELFFSIRDLDKVLEEARKILEREEPYHISRENEAAALINSFPEKIGVLFGAGHPRLERLVSESRPTEVYFPYQGFPLSFETGLREQYRQTGQIDTTLFLRSVCEPIIRARINRMGLQVTLKERELLVQKYAASLPPEKIIGLKDYMMSCSRLAEVSIDTIIDSYLKKEHFPSISDSLSSLRSQKE